MGNNCFGCNKNETTGVLGVSIFSRFYSNNKLLLYQIKGVVRNGDARRGNLRATLGEKFQEL